MPSPRSKRGQKKPSITLTARLKGHWDDAYHLLKNRAHTSEKEARSFADEKVRQIQSIERQFAHC